MKKISRRSFLAASGILAAAAALTACGQDKGTDSQIVHTQTGEEKDSSPLRVYFWEVPLIRNVASYIREQLPGKDIEFIAGNNNASLYSYLKDHGDMPDIITIRKFSAVDAKDLRPLLMDLSAYDVVSDYYPYALQYYKNADTSIQWLPVCGIPETLLVNKTLLDQYGLLLPESYADYAQLCADLAANGIKPLTLELKHDWAAHSLLQGAAIGEFTSLAGIEWRTNAESAEGDIPFDDELWHGIFSDVDTFIRDSRFTSEDLEVPLTEAKDAFAEGRAAMFHGTPQVMNELQKRMTDAEIVRIPYFSQHSEDSYIYASPSFHIAFSKALEQEPEKLETALKLLDCLISEEGQKRISGGSGVLSYSAKSPSLMDDVKGLEKEIADNSIYTRYAANQSFPASLQAVQGLISGEMDEAQAYDTFRTVMNSREEEPASITFEKQYSIFLNEKGGRDAASAILNTVRQAVGADAAISPYYYYTASIYQGSCTATQLKLLTAQDSDTPLYLETLTGDELKELIECYLTDPENSSLEIKTRYELPVTSGMKYTVQQNENGFELSGLEVGGSPVEQEKEYTVLITHGVSKCLSVLQPARELTPVDGTLSKQWRTAVTEGKTVAEPEDYIAIEQK